MGILSVDLLITLQILPVFFSNCLFLALYDSVILLKHVVLLLSRSKSTRGEWRRMLTSEGMRCIWKSFLLDAYKQVSCARAEGLCRAAGRGRSGDAGDWGLEGALAWGLGSPVWGRSGYAQVSAPAYSLHLWHKLDLGMTGIKPQWLYVTQEGAFLIRVIHACCGVEGICARD